MGAQQAKEQGSASTNAYQHSLTGLKSLKSKGRSASRNARFGSSTISGTNVFAEHNEALVTGSRMLDFVSCNGDPMGGGAQSDLPPGTLFQWTSQENLCAVSAGLVTEVERQLQVAPPSPPPPVPQGSPTPSPKPQLSSFKGKRGERQQLQQAQSLMMGNAALSSFPQMQLKSNAVQLRKTSNGAASGSNQQHQRCDKEKITAQKPAPPKRTSSSFRDSNLMDGEDPDTDDERMESGFTTPQLAQQLQHQSLHPSWDDKSHDGVVQALRTNSQQSLPCSNEPESLPQHAGNSPSMSSFGRSCGAAGVSREASRSRAMAVKPTEKGFERRVSQPHDEKSAVAFTSASNGHPAMNKAKKVKSSSPPPGVLSVIGGGTGMKKNVAITVAALEVQNVRRAINRYGTLPKNARIGAYLESLRQSGIHSTSSGGVPVYDGMDDESDATQLSPAFQDDTRSERDAKQTVHHRRTQQTPPEEETGSLTEERIRARDLRNKHLMTRSSSSSTGFPNAPCLVPGKLGAGRAYQSSRAVLGASNNSQVYRLASHSGNSKAVKSQDSPGRKEAVLEFPPPPPPDDDTLTQLQAEAKERLLNTSTNKSKAPHHQQPPQQSASREPSSVGGVCPPSEKQNTSSSSSSLRFGINLRRTEPAPLVPSPVTTPVVESDRQSLTSCESSAAVKSFPVIVRNGELSESQEDGAGKWKPSQPFSASSDSLSTMNQSPEELDCPPERLTSTTKDSRARNEPPPSQTSSVAPTMDPRPNFAHISLRKVAPPTTKPPPPEKSTLLSAGNNAGSGVYALPGAPGSGATAADDASRMYEKPQVLKRFSLLKQKNEAEKSDVVDNKHANATDKGETQRAFNAPGGKTKEDVLAAAVAEETLRMKDHHLSDEVNDDGKRISTSSITSLKKMWERDREQKQQQLLASVQKEQGSVECSPRVAAEKKMVSRRSSDPKKSSVCDPGRPEVPVKPTNKHKSSLSDAAEATKELALERCRSAEATLSQAKGQCVADALTRVTASAMSDKVKVLRETCGQLADAVPPHSRFHFREMLTALERHETMLGECVDSGRGPAEARRAINDAQGTLKDLMAVLNR
ncbi:unnamed protein product [Notodromas monacha]|uniref:F-actin binding domain-containing protein n=1 Tax=Notodromas monacha TaxID=399045 RepID=A0A7R9GFH7_9CRUS|nr:unnamed protein product [Notodromas monacha]CAG0920713.1 unnamed protein product [Notodromas monacha]